MVCLIQSMLHIVESPQVYIYLCDGMSPINLAITFKTSNTTINLSFSFNERPKMFRIVTVYIYIYI